MMWGVVLLEPLTSGGPPMQGGDSQLEVGLEIWYRCTACNDWFIVPQGYKAQEEGIEEDFWHFRSRCAFTILYLH